MTTVPLLRNVGFRYLWFGQSVSQLGSEFSSLILPFLAVSILNATEWQVALLNATKTAAFLIVGLPAGAWIDRMLKRRTMIAADFARVATIAILPVLWWLGSLRIWHLYVVGAVVGLASLFFDVSYQSYVPILIPRHQLGDANSKLETTVQLARVGGPALAGALLAVVSAPVLLIADALSYIVSVATIMRIPNSEIRMDDGQRKNLLREIQEGVRFVWNQKLIRRITATTAFSNFFSTIAFTLSPIIILRVLNLGPTGFGLSMSLGAVGGLLGAIAAPYISRQIGEGTAIVMSAFGSSLGIAALPLATLFPSAALPIVAGGEFVVLFFVLVYNITQVTMRQQLCPAQLLGRMNASIRFIVWGVMPIASLLSGFLGSTLGLLPAVWIAVVGGIFSCSFVLFSPLARLRTLPSTEHDNA